MSGANRSIDIVANLYRLLVFIYPASFRQEFGPEMIVIFRDISCAEHDKKGAAALIGLWVALFFDLVATAVVERVREVFGMSTSDLGRLAGVGGILAGVMWLGIVVFELALGLDDTEGLIWAIPPALMLPVILALYLQFEHSIFGVLGLVVFTLGTVLMVLAMIFFELGDDQVFTYNAAVGAVGAFGFSVIAYSIQGIGLLMTGIALRSRGCFKPWSTTLIPLGAFLMLFWPIAFPIGSILSLTDQHAGIIWLTNWVVSSVAWIVLGAIVLASYRQPPARHTLNTV